MSENKADIELLIEAESIIRRLIARSQDRKEAGEQRGRMADYVPLAMMQPGLRIWDLAGMLRSEDGKLMCEVVRSNGIPGGYRYAFEGGRRRLHTIPASIQRTTPECLWSHWIAYCVVNGTNPVPPGGPRK